MKGYEDCDMEQMLANPNATASEVSGLLVSVLAAKCTGSYDQVPSDELLLDMAMLLDSMIDGDIAAQLKNAERYRWLRDNVDIETEYYHQQDACGMTLHFHCPPEMFFCTEEEEPGIDEAIDAAMTGETR